MSNPFSGEPITRRERLLLWWRVSRSLMTVVCRVLGPLVAVGCFWLGWTPLPMGTAVQLLVGNAVAAVGGVIAGTVVGLTLDMIVRRVWIRPTEENRR